MTRDCIFVSYSHADEEWLRRLRIFLKPFPWGRSYKDGGRVWADPYIRTGEVWEREIKTALARTRIAVLLVSQDFLASDFITKSELPPLLKAAEAGEVTLVCIPVRTSVVDLAMPVLLKYQWPRPHDQPLDLLGSAEREAALAQIFRELFDLAQAADLTEGVSAAGAPAARAEAEAVPLLELAAPSRSQGRLYGVPLQRPNFVPRPDLREQIRTRILTGSRGSVGLTGGGRAETPGSIGGSIGGSVGGSVGVFGQGGLGKTVAAIDLVHDEEVQGAFPDGIYWLTLGQTPDLVGLQSLLIRQLTGSRQVVESVTAGTAEIQRLFRDRACLLVLDDVWSFPDACAFDVGGDRCRTLLTTRDANLVTALGAEEIELDVLTEPQALALLAKWTEQPVDSLPDEAKTLVRRCGYLPLAVSVAGALVRDGQSWTDLLEALEAGNLRFFEHPYASVFTSLRLSIDHLEDDERARFLELAVMPEDEVVPVSVVARFWEHTGGLQGYESRGLLKKLKAKGLLYLEEDSGGEVVRLHDLQRDFLQLAAEDLPGLHARLLDAFAPLHRAWWTLPEDERYLWRHLTHHLAMADRYDELRSVLLDYDWIAAKLRITDIDALLADYDRLAGDRTASLIQGALRLSANVLGKDPDQLAGQLSGRLLSFEEEEIAALLQRAAKSTSIPWLRPLTGSLQPPGGPLVRTLEGHDAEVNGVAVTSEGRRAISASFDGTLKVWEVVTGSVLHSLEGHGGAVNDVAVTSDGAMAVSGSDDTTLKVWDLATGAALRTLEGHAASVHSVAVTADASKAVSACWDGTLKVWDLATGALLRTLEGHSEWAHAVAVAPDGNRAVSASADCTLKVWDLATGAVLHILRGHDDAVRGVAVTSDGRWVISASSDKTLRVWDLSTGELVRTLEGHSEDVFDVEVTADGTRVVSASADRTLKVWDLATGALLRSLQGHAGSVRSVAWLADGKLAVSASWDGTLRVWDPKIDAVVQIPEVHDRGVRGIAVTSDGARAVSASWDGTLKVWDPSIGTVLQTAKGDKREVSDVAVLSDGMQAVSACWDGALSVWDLSTGAISRSLRPQDGGVRRVAVTPDGGRVVIACWDGTLKVRDLATGAVLDTLKDHARGVNSVDMTPDGRWVVSASEDCSLKVWDLASGAVLHTLEGHGGPVLGLAVTPDGTGAVSASEDTTLKVWDLSTGAVCRTLQGHGRGVCDVAVTSDSKRVVSASWDHTLRVWDLALGTVLATFTGDAAVLSCAIATNGGAIVVGDALGRVHFLRLENG